MTMLALKVRLGVAAALAASVIAPGTALAKSGATIAGEFGDSCRHFEAHSSKEISHVVIHYADGRAVKDESVATRDFVTDGDAISAVDVKSSTTRTTFACTPTTDSPPTAVLQTETPPIDTGGFEESCDSTEGPPDLYCLYEAARSAWTSWEVGAVVWGFCPGHDSFCYDYPPDQVPFTFSFRGISSTDPDGDIMSWSIDFGDGTSASGSWTADPPTELEHTYISGNVGDGATLTLTVTDSAGNTDTALLTFRLVTLNPI